MVCGALGLDWCGVTNKDHNLAGGIALVIISLIALSTSAFLLVRYQHGDQPPHPALPSTCWYLAAASLVTVLLCAVAPFFKILRKIRWTFWIVSFGLWVNAAVITHRIPGWGTDSEGRYCKMVQVQHCKHIEVLLNPILSISMMSSILPTRTTRNHLGAMKSLGGVIEFDVWMLGRSERKHKSYRCRRYIQSTFAPVPAPEVDVGPPEHQQSPVGAGSVPGPPDPAHVRASTLGNERNIVVTCASNEEKLRKVNNEYCLEQLPRFATFEFNVERS
ncbi:hypothetical protein BKA70DRAFT_1308557 [Coprinopsis sp. MPI-PUGE-AT-0042]|nr:hypothetical protein BKA70DRAFT_1308557 [Coprinopsis sp. MPI-PUGE-AT-0042]